MIFPTTPAGAWLHPLPDGLNSVRGVVSDALSVLETVTYTPYGVPDTALTATDFAFTGEMRDANGLQYHRARYYDPALAVWGGLDPFEGIAGRPMSLNGYGWVEGNVTTKTDKTGMSPSCQQTELCEQMTRNNYPAQQLELAGCYVPERENCCGPIIDEWFRKTVNRNIRYNAVSGIDDDFITMVLDEALTADLSFYDIWDFARLENVPQYRLGVYGIALRTGIIDFREMAETPANVYTPNYTDPEKTLTNGNQLITLCGRCIQATDLGNFLFGVAGYAWGFTEEFTVGGAMVFNGVTQDWANILPTGYDIHGVRLGYRFAQQGSSHSVDDLCSRISMNTGWNSQPDPRFLIPNTRIPCGLLHQSANLDNAPTPMTRWDRYIWEPPVTSSQNWQFASPVEELHGKWQR